MDFQNAKAFLSRVLPWDQSSETPVYCNLHWRYAKQGVDPKAYPWSGRAVTSVDDMIKRLQWVAKLPDTRDIYICMSSQASAVQRISKNGYPYLAAQRSKADAVALKTFYIDIDFKGGENGYDTQVEAVQALGEFLTKTGLPRPNVVVATGGGIHVYWVLDKPIDPISWHVRATALAEATKELGLKNDAQCTVDAARILRVPDTFNFKKDPKRPVELKLNNGADVTLEVIDQALDRWINKIQLPVLAPRSPMETEDEFSAGIEMRKRDPVKLSALADACPWIKDSLDNGGEHNDNALRRQIYILSQFLEDPRQSAWDMVCDRETLDQEEFDHEMDRVEREWEQKDFGWPKCKTISALGCKLCTTCPHQGDGKTPFHFLISAPPPPLTSPPKGPNWDIPHGYRRTAQNIIERQIVDLKDPTNVEWRPVLNYPLYEPWLQKGPWVLNFKSSNHAGNEVSIALTFEEANSSQQLRPALARQGISTRGGASAKVVEDFMSSWIEQLQRAKESVVQSSPFGWNERNGKLDGFIYQGHWTPNGVKPSALGDPIIASHYTPSGDAQSWLEAANLVQSQNKPELNAILASAFAAPLVRFTGREGLMLSIYSAKSGIGKTTAMKTACAVWGHPVRALQGVSDTSLSVMNRIGQLRSLPLYWDELKTDEDTKRFVNMMFELTRGREKARLTNTVKQREAKDWQTMLVSASNESIIDTVVDGTKMSLAGLYRTFEVAMENVPISQGLISPAEADVIVSRLNGNYGVIGQQYAKWLGANYERVEGEVVGCRKVVEEETLASNDERFWTSLIAVLLMGAQYSNDLEFTQINMAQLKDFLYASLDEMRKHITGATNDMSKSVNVQNVLAAYLNSTRAYNTLVTTNIHLGRGRPPSGFVQVLRDASHMKEVYVQIGVQNKVMRINSSHFHDWLRHRKYSTSSFMKAFAEQVGYLTVNGRMGSGTLFNSASPEYMIQIDLNSPHFKEYLEELEDQK